MASVDYIQEKVWVALETLCAGTGSFEERLADAHLSALMQLSSNDATAEIAEELNWVLHLCERHLVPGKERMSPVPELDRIKVAEKLVNLLVKTSQMMARD